MIIIPRRLASRQIARRRDIIIPTGGSVVDVRIGDPLIGTHGSDREIIIPVSTAWCLEQFDKGAEVMSMSYANTYFYRGRYGKFFGRVQDVFPMSKGGVVYDMTTSGGEELYGLSSQCIASSDDNLPLFLAHARSSGYISKTHVKPQRGDGYYDKYNQSGFWMLPVPQEYSSTEWSFCSLPISRVDSTYGYWSPVNDETTKEGKTNYYLPIVSILRGNDTDLKYFQPDLDEIGTGRSFEILETIGKIRSFSESWIEELQHIEMVPWFRMVM